MSRGYASGLGEPQPVGKKALFKPAVETGYSPEFKNETSSMQSPETLSTSSRIRTTLELTKHALSIIQEIQCSHRLETGKVLPLWKLVSQAIESYGKSTSNLITTHPEPALHDPDGKR